MSRKRVTALSVAAACVLVAALMLTVYVFYFGGDDRTIVLPSPAETSSGLGLESPAPAVRTRFEPVEVAAGNVRELLLAMSRPHEYSVRITTTWYWEGGAETKTHVMRCRDGVVRLVTFEDGEAAKNLILSGGSVWQWEEGGVFADMGAASGVNAEDLGGIPTWEDIVSLPEGGVLSAEYGYSGGRRVLRVTTSEEFYDGDYRISVDTGLLEEASFTDSDGNVVYVMKMEEPDLSRPGDEYFTLPGGELVEARQ